MLYTSTVFLVLFLALMGMAQAEDLEKITNKVFFGNFFFLFFFVRQGMNILHLRLRCCGFFLFFFVFL